MLAGVVKDSFLGLVGSNGLGFVILCNSGFCSSNGGLTLLVGGMESVFCGENKHTYIGRK